MSRTLSRVRKLHMELCIILVAKKNELVSSYFEEVNLQLRSTGITEFIEITMQPRSKVELHFLTNDVPDKKHIIPHTSFDFSTESLPSFHYTVRYKTRRAIFPPISPFPNKINPTLNPACGSITISILDETKYPAYYHLPRRKFPLL